MNWSGSIFSRVLSYRLAFDIVLLAGLYFLPLPLFAVLSLLGVLVFKHFYEPALLFFFIESVFSAPVEGFYPFLYFWTIGFLLAVVIAQELKNILSLKI